MSVATAYAKSLYEVALEAKSSATQLDEVENQLDSFGSFLETSREARVALLGPVATIREKTAIIEEVCKILKFSDLVMRFMVLLAKKGRLSLLKPIRDSFSVVRLSHEGGLAGQLVAAEPVGDADIVSLAKAFSHRLGKKVNFRVSTDASLLAGMKVTVNGVTYDGTLRSQLQKLRDRFVSGLPGTHA